MIKFQLFYIPTIQLNTESGNTEINTEILESNTEILFLINCACFNSLNHTERNRTFNTVKTSVLLLTH